LQASFDAPTDTVLYLDSDDYADQNDKQRRNLESKRLKNLLVEIGHISMIDQQQLLESELELHMEGTYQKDDILLIRF
jgi:Zn finger protein HypA/HybF involved in hydrogenase expression